MPPQATLINNDDIADPTPTEKRDWQKWLKNLDFIKYVISAMTLMYVVDILLAWKAPEVSVSLRDPFFEILKTLLFTVAGYVFAKSSD